MSKTTRRAIALVPAIAAFLVLGGCNTLRGTKPKTAVLGERVPILTSENDASVEPSIADVQVLLPEPVANESWDQPGGNAAKSMGHLALGGSLARAWEARVAGVTKSERLAAAPVVSGATLVGVAGVALVSLVAFAMRNAKALRAS